MSAKSSFSGGSRSFMSPRSSSTGTGTLEPSTSGTDPGSSSRPSIGEMWGGAGRGGAGRGEARRGGAGQGGAGRGGAGRGGDPGAEH